MSHTPTPWSINDFSEQFDRLNIVTDGPVLVATLSTNKQKCNAAELGQVFDNAAHIVHCVNVHDALVEALHKVHANAAESPEWIRNVIDKALALAEKGQQS